MSISNHLFLANGVENFLNGKKSSSVFASASNKVTKVSLNQPGERRQLKKWASLASKKGISYQSWRGLKFAELHVCGF